MGVCERTLAADAPNVILMMADDMGWGDVGFNGNKTVRTPHLDDMAKNSLRFERFYAASAVCSPTRGSCLTGRHPSRYGIPNANAGHLPAEEVTIQSLLKSKGYATGHFGKWHLGTLTKTEKDANRGGPGGAKHYAPPWERSFDVNYSTESKVPTWDPLWKPNDAKGGTWWDPIDGDGDPRKLAAPYGTSYWSSGKRVEGDLRGDDSQFIMDRAIEFIQGATKEKKPFFAVIWFHAPHLPVVAGPRFMAMYKDEDQHSQHYKGCITALDEQVGRLREQLRKLDAAENTMLWFCSDNGPEGSAKDPGSAGGLRGRKRDLYEGGVRVPGLLEWPVMIKAARTTNVPACTSDYLPTVVEAAGLKLPNDRPIDGISLLPLIKGEMNERPVPIAFHFGGMIALSDNRFKLMMPAGAVAKNKKKDGDGSVMLFDLIADRGEQKNIADEHPTVVSEMKAILAAWRESCERSGQGLDYHR
ncbi:MAG: sulfatase-like hydrolase/transferase [Phycisphaeraceae bacterium]